MKKHINTILACLIVSLMFGTVVSANWFTDLFQRGYGARTSDFWLVRGGDTLEPSDTTYNVQIPSLVSCNTIDTNSDGLLACGTDDSGGGSSGSGIGWASTTNDLLIYNKDGADSSPYTVLIQSTGVTATTTSGKIFEVIGDSEFDSISAPDMNIREYLEVGSTSLSKLTGYEGLQINAQSGTGDELSFRIAGEVNETGIINFGKMSGSLTSPGAVSNSDKLGAIDFWAYGGSTWRRVGSIQNYVNSTDTINDVTIPTYLAFYTSPGFPATITEKMRLSSGGTLMIASTTITNSNNKLEVTGTSLFDGVSVFNYNVGIGTTSPYAKLSVVGQTVSDYFTATSTSATSTFPNLSTTQFEVTGLINCDTINTDASGYAYCGSDATGTGGAGTISTSTTPTIGQLSYWTGTGWPSTLGSAATTTLTENSLALSLSQPISVIGGSASILSLSTSTLFSYPWTVAEGGTGSTTLSGILKGNGTGGIATAVNGIDYTLITTQSCTNQVITALTAAGGSTCSSVSNAMLSNSTISGVALGSNLNALTNDTTLNGSSYNGSGAISDWGLNLANANTWTALQTFNNNASTTGLTVSGSTYLNNAFVYGNLYIATSTDLVINTSGQIGINITTASSSMRFATSTGEIALYPDTPKVYPFASTTLAYIGGYSATGTTTVPWGCDFRPEMIINIHCKTFGASNATALLQVGDGTASTTNGSATISCTATGGTQTPTSNNSFHMRDCKYFGIGTQANNPNIIQISVQLMQLAD